MHWECSECGNTMLEYACLGHGSEIDNGCPKCGCVNIWFYQWAYRSIPMRRILMDVKTKKELKTQEVIPHVEYSFKDVKNDTVQS